MHFEATHAVLQGKPHSLQLFLSLLMLISQPSATSPLQSRLSLSQLSSHLPATHAGPVDCFPGGAVGQALSHSPQWRGLVKTSTSWVPHIMGLAGPESLPPASRPESVWPASEVPEPPSMVNAPPSSSKTR